MRLFEFVAKEDVKRDLARLDNAAIWLTTLKFWPQSATTSEGETTGHWSGWKGDDGPTFGRHMRAVRSLYGRFYPRRKSLPSGISPFVADTILRQQVNQLTVKLVVQTNSRPDGPLPLSPQRVLGYEIVPGNIRTTWAPSGLLMEFWQHVFWSLIADDPVRVCQVCGRRLPGKTPTGRTSKKRFCITCTDRRYKKTTMTAEARRRMWREQKRSQRGGN